MKIHSDVLLPRAFWQASMAAGVDLVDYSESGSRSRKRAYNFSLSGSSPYQRGFGAGGQAATWDEWGIFLNYLFKIDPNAHCGKNSYLSAEHFHWMTGDRFRHLSRANQHKRHKWGLGQANCTGAYSVSRCECGAIQRWVLRDHSWEDISESV